MLKKFTNNYFYLFISLLILIITLFFIFSNSDPNVIPSIVLLMVFCLIYFASLIILILFNKLIGDIIVFLIPHQNKYSISEKRLITLTIINCLPIYILTIQSIRNISFYEIILIGLLIIISIFIINKKSI